MTNYIETIHSAEVKLLAMSTPTYQGKSIIRNKYLEAGAELYPLDMATIASSYGSVTMEYAGRGCYEAYGKFNDETHRTDDYLRNILKQAHFSVLEHSSYTFEFTGVSRALTHELVRHRHFSFSQESQRFVWNPNYITVVVPPALRGLISENVWVEDDMETPDAVKSLAGDRQWQRFYYDLLRKEGKTKKQAAEAARAFLTNAYATHIVVTGNARSWIEFILKRLDPAADKEIHDLAFKVLVELAAAEPHIFGNKSRELWSNEVAQGEARHDG